jgi:RNA polymerase-binding transcription factor DksA
MIPVNLITCPNDHMTLTTTQLDHYKQRLLEEKERLTQELNDFGKEDPVHPGQFEPTYPESGSNSEDDNAMEIAEFADDASIEARVTAELRDVESALKAIEAGNYGICKYCNQPIDEKRLEARPASSSCISCKKVLTQEM